MSSTSMEYIEHHVKHIPVWGGLESENAKQQIKMCADEAIACALMADHHLGYSMPIGGVAAYKGKVSPSGVGYDIACGNKAVKLDLQIEDIDDGLGNLERIADRIFDELTFGAGGANQVEIVDHELFDSELWNLDFIKEKKLKHKARQQLGTIGSGNHYVDVFFDENGYVWVGVHFGSRGFGHAVATHHVKAGGGKDGIHVAPVLLDETSDLGAQYIECMNLAGQYAYAGRDWVCNHVAKILEAEIIDEVHNHHNFAWKEHHFGEDVWVVRKGATPAFPGQRGFVGSSMAEPSVILEGKSHPQADIALKSTVHGAGRVMGRREAAGSFRWKRLEDGKPKVLVQTKEGKISEDMMMEKVKQAEVILRGGGCDEAPQCYKRLSEVLDHHNKTINILHTLTPVIVCMAGKEDWR